MKHTPGPWKIEQPYGSNKVYVVASYYEDEPSLQVLVQDCTLEQTHKQANARLIAAAPDLLAALIDVRSYLIKTRDAAPLSAPAVVKAMIQIQVDKCDRAIGTAVGGK